ncbi:hypothetical protein [Streptomyces sp. NPDC002537]
MTRTIRRTATALAALALGAAALTVTTAWWNHPSHKAQADETVTTAAWWNHPSHHAQ